MQNSPLIYKKNFHIDLRDADFSKQLKLSHLFSYFQDIANLAADQLNAGIETLLSKGISWVLVKVRVDIERMPKLDEEIIIETWPLSPGKIDFERDFLVKDLRGNIIIRAISSWVVMDIKERRIKRTNTIHLTYSDQLSERAINEKFKRLKDSGNLERVYEKSIGYSDIDFNGHLNNSKYIDYILDCFTINEHIEYKIKSIEINFMNEALPGDQITLLKDLTEFSRSEVYVEGKDERTKKTIFKSLIEIANKKK